MKALKIVHQKVIDTEKVFPHPRGLPFTNSLKFIVQNTFSQQFQQMSHDSKEDAIACMHLMLRRILPELRKQEAEKMREKDQWQVNPLTAPPDEREGEGDADKTVAANVSRAEQHISCGAGDSDHEIPAGSQKRKREDDEIGDKGSKRPQSSGEGSPLLPAD